MGYRSDWRIAFNTHHKARHVEHMLKDFVTNNPSHCVSPLLEEMLRLAVSYEDDSLFILEEVRWKLGCWDELMDVLCEMFDGDPEVDFATIRLGEDQDDNDIQCGDYTYLYVRREIDDTDFDPVPAAEQKKSIQSVKTTCECDLHQLMRGAGHDNDCPEK